MKKKKDEDFIDFGQWLYEKRQDKGITEEQLVSMMAMQNVQEVNIRKWERDLEFPSLDAIYKLSEIYQVPSAEIIELKNKTLQDGVNAIHKQLIRWLSFFMGLSIYGTIWLSRILVYGTLILAWVWFYFMMKSRGVL